MSPEGRKPPHPTAAATVCAPDVRRLALRFESSAATMDTIPATHCPLCGRRRYDELRVIEHVACDHLDDELADQLQRELVRGLWPREAITRDEVPT